MLLRLKSAPYSFFRIHPVYHRDAIVQLAMPSYIYRRNYASSDQGKEKKSNSALTDKTGQEKSYLEEMLLEKEKEPKTAGQKVKRAAETSFYVTFAVVSLVTLGGLSYLLFKELFSFSSPQGLFKNALKKVKQDDRCIELFGKNMMAHGELTGRGRRRHIANQRFQKDGQERLRIMFHLKGKGHIGKAHVEVTKVDSNWEYRFLIVEIDSSSNDPIVIIDNR